jgi:hypothetical protein
VITLFLAGAVYYYPAQKTALSKGDVENFRAWPLIVIGIGGGILGIVAAFSVGDRQVRPIIRDVALGALVGVFFVVVGTYIWAHALVGSDSKKQASYLVIGLRIGVIAGLL